MAAAVLPLHCAYCGRPISLIYERGPTDMACVTSYICPYTDCDVYRVQQVAVPGTLRSVWQGHDPPLADDRDGE